MEKRIVWFGVLWKMGLRRPVLWLQTGAMVLFLWLAVTVTLPDKGNMCVLLYNEDGDFGEKLIENLINSDSSFSFREVQGEKEMYQEILAGRAECGFWLKKGLEEGLRQEKEQGLVCFVGSELGSKGISVRETFYQELFSLSSDLLLQRRAEDLFEENVREDALAYMRMRNSDYLTGNEVFHVIYEEIGDEKGRESGNGPIHPIRGIAAAIILLNILLLQGEDIGCKKGGYEKSLPSWERREFLFWKYLIGSFPLVLAAFLSYQMFGLGSNPLLEMGKLLALLVVSSLWVMVLGISIRKEAAYYGWLCPAFTMNLLLPPVFFSFSTYIPAVGGLNWLLPVGIYLKM